MGLIKVAISGAEYRDSLGKLQGGGPGILGFRSRAQKAQGTFDSLQNAQTQLKNVQNQIRSLPAGHAGIHDLTAQSQKLQGQVSSHAANLRQIVNPSGFHAADHALAAGATASKVPVGKAAEKATSSVGAGMLDKVKSFASNNKTALGVGAGLVGAGLIANHIIKKKQQAQQQYI